jgi:hypothetical protein
MPNADSNNWATPFNSPNGTYDFNHFDVTNCPFYKCCTTYYNSGANGRQTSYSNNGSSINLASSIIDPTNSGTIGIKNKDYLINGFTTSYLLGYTKGITSNSTYAYITENAFNLIDKTDGTTTTWEGAQNIVASMQNIKTLYSNNGMKYTNVSVYQAPDFQRGFYGVFNGYFQGYLDAVHYKSKGASATQISFSDLLALKNEFCRIAGDCKNNPPTTEQGKKYCKIATDECDRLTKELSGYNVNDPKSLPSASSISSMISTAKSNMNMLQNNVDTTDYAAKYGETLAKLYLAVKTQNDTVLNEIQNNIDVFSTDDQKVYYQQMQIQRLSYTNIVLLILYYILFLVTLYFIFGIDTKIEKWTKWATVAFLAIYPFIINTLFIWMYDAWLYFYSLINTNVYAQIQY